MTSGAAESPASKPALPAVLFAQLELKHPRVAAVLRYSLPFIGLILAFTLFSLYTVLMKSALSEGTSPLVLALLRELFAVALLLPLAHANERRLGTLDRFWIKEAHFLQFFLLGLFMIWGVQLLSALSLEHLSANTYALLAPSVPVICACVAIFAGYEPFDPKRTSSWMKIGAIAVAVFGAGWIAIGAYLGSSAKEKGNVVLGLSLLIVNKCCVATYPVMEKSLMKSYRPFTIVAWGYTTGAFLVLLSIIPCALSDSGLWHIGPAGWKSILFSAFVTSSFNYALMAEINKVTSPLTVMSFYPWQSICTPLLSYSILGLPLAASDGMGGALICLGLFLLVLARWKEGAAAPSDYGTMLESPDLTPAVAQPETALEGRLEWETGRV
jgi:drug/metabolite transporter (DMT)-like permease